MERVEQIWQHAYGVKQDEAESIQEERKEGEDIKELTQGQRERILTNKETNR
jgi:hypothetical protein